MRPALLARVMITNAAVLGLIWVILQDDWGRNAYFGSLGFTPSTTYYPFFYITSAVKGATLIPGQLTLDWVQVLGVVLLVLDFGFALPFLRRRSAERPSAIAPNVA